MAFPQDLVVGQWYKVPRIGNSQLADVYATPNPGGNQTAIINGWGGFAYDTVRKHLIVCGGGHTDYSGNEVYVFDCDPTSGTYLTWRIINFYSTPRTGNEDYADGTPTSYHGYSCTLYDTSRDRYIRGSGVAIYDAGTFTDRFYSLDPSVNSPTTPDASKWTHLSANVADQLGGSEGVDAYDPQTTKYFCYATSGVNSMNSFNPSAAAGSRLVQHTNFDSPCLAGHNMTATIGVTGGISYFGMIGGAVGNLQIMRLSDFTWMGSGGAGFGATGATAIEGAAAPGFIWDDINERFTAWGGLLSGGTDRRDYYTLNMSTKVWTRNAGTGDTPDAPSGNGTFNKLVYMGSGLCILVNSTTSDVYFLRVSGSGGGSGPCQRLLMGVGRCLTLPLTGLEWLRHRKNRIRARIDGC